MFSTLEVDHDSCGQGGYHEYIGEGGERGDFRSSKGYDEYIEGYHEYTGECSVCRKDSRVHREVFSTSEGYHGYIRDVAPVVYCLLYEKSFSQKLLISFHEQRILKILSNAFHLYFDIINYVDAFLREKSFSLLQLICCFLLDTFTDSTPQ